MCVVFFLELCKYVFCKMFSLPSQKGGAIVFYDILCLKTAYKHLNFLTMQTNCLKKQFGVQKKKTNLNFDKPFCKKTILKESFFSNHD